LEGVEEEGFFFHLDRRVFRFRINRTAGSFERGVPTVIRENGKGEEKEEKEKFVLFHEVSNSLVIFL